MESHASCEASLKLRPRKKPETGRNTFLALSRCVCLCVYVLGEGVEPIKQSNRAAKEDQSKGTKTKAKSKSKSQTNWSSLEPQHTTLNLLPGPGGNFQVISHQTNQHRDGDTEKESERERYRQSEPKER